MSNRRPRHLPKHVRPRGVAYAALAVAFSFSPVPSTAADLVTTGDVANGAITTAKLAADSVTSARVLNDAITSNDIKNGSVGTVDLNNSAKGAKVIRYDLGSHDFKLQPQFYTTLPGVWDAETVAASQWTATLYVADISDGVPKTFIVPGKGPNNEQYYLGLTDGGRVFITTGSFGEEVDRISVYRTVTTSIQNAPQWQ